MFVGVKMNTVLKMKILNSGMSQIGLAWKLKMSEPVLSKIVQGWIDPDLKTKKRIARALGCTVEEIFPPKEEISIETE